MIQQQLNINQQFIIPKLAGAALKLNDGEAYVLLEILARAGVLDRAFNVYCKQSGMLLATVPTEDKLGRVHTNEALR